MNHQDMCTYFCKRSISCSKTVNFLSTYSHSGFTQPLQNLERRSYQAMQIPKQNYGERKGPSVNVLKDISSKSILSKPRSFLQPKVCLVVWPSHRRIKAQKSGISLAGLRDRIRAYLEGQISFAELQATVEGFFGSCRSYRLAWPNPAHLRDCGLAEST